MLYLHTAGPQDAPAIVFLHGGGLSGRMWQPQFERLPDYYCLAPDLPEQGCSLAIHPFTLDGAAARVAAIIGERVPRGRAHLVGLSLGGAVAITLLRTSPQSIDHVLVSGSAAGLGRILGGLSKATAVLYRYLNPETLIKASFKQFGIPAGYQAMFREDILRSTNATFIRNYTDALMRMQLPTVATSPTLIAVGEHETLVAKQAARKLVATMSGARGIVVPKVGHVWNLQAPDLFTDTVRAWISDQPLPPVLRRL